MKEVIFRKLGTEDELELIDSAIPTADKGEVVVKASAIAVNPVDNLMLSGLYPVGDSLPHRLGTDASGVIHEVGSGVSGLKAGDKVWVYFPDYNGCGTYAEYFKCPATRVHLVPQNVDLKASAGLGIPFITAHNVLNIANARPSEVLLVNGGSGAVGRAGIQLGRMIGMTVIATAGSDEGLKLIKGLGAHHAINYKDPQLQQKIMDCSGGKGADVILEPVADVNIGNDVEVAAVEGRIVGIGIKSMNATFNFGTMMRKRCSIQGYTVFYASESDLRQSAAYLHAGLRSGSLTPTIGCEFPLKDVKKAFALLKSGKAKGKIILIP